MTTNTSPDPAIKVTTNEELDPAIKLAMLIEQIHLIRKQFVNAHEQLARIESKIDRLNAQLRKREAIRSNLGSCY